MITQTTTYTLKEAVTHSQGINQRHKRTNLHARNLAQTIHIGLKCRWILHRHSLIGTPCRQNLTLEAIFTTFDMMLQRIHRIIRCANHLHIITPHQSACRIFRLLQHVRTMVIYLARSLGIKQSLHSEGGL